METKYLLTCLSSSVQCKTTGGRENYFNLKNVYILFRPKKKITCVSTNPTDLNFLCLP